MKYLIWLPLIGILLLFFNDNLKNHLSLDITNLYLIYQGICFLILTSYI